MQQLFRVFLSLIGLLAVLPLQSQQDTLPQPFAEGAGLALLPAAPDTLALSRPDIALLRQGEGYALHFKAPEKLTGIQLTSINKATVALAYEAGEAFFPVELSQRGELYLIANGRAEQRGRGYADYQMLHLSKGGDGSPQARHIPLWLSVLPPVIAIALALIFREVIVSLFVGVWAGAFIIGGLRVDSLYYFMMSLWEVVSRYVVTALVDTGHTSVMVFSLMIGGMVALISRNGGMAGVVEALSKYARTPTSAQFTTWFLGVAIFFDDYANTLIVGNTMRSVTDRFRISREKLAYLVDSTAAPVAAIAFITTWIGAELGYIESGVQQLVDYNYEHSAYAIFIHSLKYSYYPILTLLFMLLLIYAKRDFGPMFRAEVRARTTGEVAQRSGDKTEEVGMEDLTPVPGIAFKWYNAGIPVLGVILMTVFGLLDTGMHNTYAAQIEAGIAVPSSAWGHVWAAIDQMSDAQSGFGYRLGVLIGNADSYQALLWASLSGVLLALGLTLGGRLMKLEDSMNTLLMGFKTMLPALIILALAWSLAEQTGILFTKDFLTSTLSGALNPYLIPTAIFVLAGFISFSTGSSWSTMAILYPIAIPATWAICKTAGLEDPIALEILYNVIATVLAASVLGDHCSPISDTTILSSLASDCRHIDHVRTQLPYALTVGAVSLACGTFVTMLGGGWGVSLTMLLAGLIVLYGIVRYVGRPVD